MGEGRIMEEEWRERRLNWKEREMKMKKDIRERERGKNGGERENEKDGGEKVEKGRWKGKIVGKNEKWMEERNRHVR